MRWESAGLKILKLNTLLPLPVSGCFWIKIGVFLQLCGGFKLLKCTLSCGFFKRWILSSHVLVSS